MKKQKQHRFKWIKLLLVGFVLLSLSACSVVYQQKEIESYVVGQNELLAKGYRFDRVSIRRFVNVEEVFSVDNEEELALLVMKNFEQGMMRTNYVSDQELVLQRVYLFLETVLYDSFHLQAGVIAQVDSLGDDPYQTRFIDVIVDEDRLVESKDYAKRIVESLNIKELTQREQIKQIHDYLVLNTEYDESLLELDISAYQDHPAFTPYGVYVQNMAVCSGYARAFVQLSAELNIPALMVSSQNMNHAWNVVYLDGEWLFLDATWNDPVPDRKGRVLDTYLLLNLNQFKNVGHHFFDLASSQTLGIEEVFEFGEFAFAIENQ
jgi:hypothetical protein